MGNVVNNLQNITRWFLLIGVLTGIFFSSGEGIQLFPFPVMSETAADNSVALQDELYKSYSLSLHNSAGFSAVFKAKTQKGFKDPAAANSFRNESRATVFFYSSPKQNNFETTFSPSSILFSSSSDRAPPVV